jgi:hypothetical protein
MNDFAHQAFFATPEPKAGTDFHQHCMGPASDRDAGAELQGPLAEPASGLRCGFSGVLANAGGQRLVKGRQVTTGKNACDPQHGDGLLVVLVLLMGRR